MRVEIMRKLTSALLMLVAASTYATFTLAATREEADQAIARAEASVKQAASLKNQWTTTTQALDAARKAGASGDAEKALRHAQEAEALAKASIAQKTMEDQAWKDAVIK